MKRKRVIKRRAELARAIDQQEKLAMKREQAKKDIETAGEKWHKWEIEERRQFIRMVTDAITLEEIASGWLRLVIVWSPLMGFLESVVSSMRAVDVAFIWRQAGGHWEVQMKRWLN